MSEMAGRSLSSRAMARSEAEIFSPVDTSASNSLALGVLDMLFARVTNSSVVFPMAETTMTMGVFLGYERVLSAMAWMRSVDPTDVPPNFCTMMSLFVMALILIDFWCSFNSICVVLLDKGFYALS